VLFLIAFAVLQEVYFTETIGEGKGLFIALTFAFMNAVYIGPRQTAADQILKMKINKKLSLRLIGLSSAQKTFSNATSFVKLLQLLHSAE